MKHTILRAACVGTLIAANGAAQAVAISGQGTWETTLHARDLDGNLATFEAYYDTVLGITWLADANYAMTNGYAADGWMSWSSANAWAASLNPYGSGITGWRLPTVSPIDGDTADDLLTASNIGTEDRGYNISAPDTLYAGSTASEMAHLFYNTLGNKAYCNPITSTVSSCSGPQAGLGLSNDGPFSNIQSDYWSATEFAPATVHAWGFYFGVGVQEFYDKAWDLSAWAVHEGDVGVAVSNVPAPAAAWLFVGGLFGLLGMSRSCRS